MVLLSGLFQVTVITPFAMQNTTKASFRTVQLTGVLESFGEKMPKNMMTSVSRSIPGLSFLMIAWMGKSSVEYVMEHENVKAFLKEDNHFDLVIVESFGTDALYGFGEYFNAPVIAIGTTSAVKIFSDVVGNPTPWPYIPNLPTGYTKRMNLYQRCVNYFFYALEHFIVEFIHYPIQSSLHKRYFSGATKSLRQMISEDISLIFLNTHHSLDQPRPYVPNMIEIGGINIDRKVGKLPEDFQNFLDSAEDGVILFSMGSMLQASNFEPKQRNAFISAFSKLKQKVIWRYNLPDTDQLPKNILTSQWLPQKEILAHPNIKVFITHGGMLGTTESAYHGVPLIGIPIFGDQPLNIARAVNRGYALRLNLEDISEASILGAINEILNNTDYSESAKYLSKIYRDQPMTPQELVSYWTNYVLNHSGAKHLRVEAQNLNFFAYHGLDVALVFILILVLPQWFILKFVIRKFTRKASTSKKLKKK